MVSDTSSNVSSILPPPRRSYNTSSSSSSTLSSTVRFSVPPSIGRVRVSQSVDRDFDPSIRSSLDTRRSRGTSPATFTAFTGASSSGASASTFRRRYSVASTSPGTGRTDIGVLDHRSVRDIDDELDFDHRRSTASMIRRARRSDVIYTADGSRPVGSTYRSDTGLTLTPSELSSRARSRSNSRLREFNTDSADAYLLDGGASVSNDDETDDVIRRRARSALARSRSRAMSLPRIETVSTVSAAASRQPSSGTRQQYSSVASSSTASSRVTPSAARASSVTRSSGGVYSTPSTGSASTGRVSSTYSVDLPGHRGVINGNGEGWDIASLVLQPGEKFVPTDVSVNVLPSGQKAVTYTRFSQTGHGDQGTANLEIERVIQRTKRMQFSPDAIFCTDGLEVIRMCAQNSHSSELCASPWKLQESMHTLENFVKRNRSLFPEDIIIYQHIVFYLLDATELKRLGMKPDAEVYGVKVRERLVAPHGSDVAAILKRYYSRHTEVEVEYLEQETIRRKLREEMAEGGAEEDAKSKRRRQYRTDIEETTETEIETRRNRSNNKQSQSPSIERRHASVDRKLHVKEDETVKRRTRHQPEEVAPQFSSRLQSKRVHAGEMVRLNCSVTGSPDPVVTWYRGDQQIVDNERFYTNNTFGLCTLKILDARKEDAGVYTARAVNRVGEMTTCADILVEVKEELKVSREEATRKPWFLIDAQNTTSQVGQRAVLEAQAGGRPLPTFRWQKDGYDVDLDLRVRQVSDEFGNIKLFIRDVKPTDAGVYACVAENDAGSARCSAVLRVTTTADTVDRRPIYEPNGIDRDNRVSSPWTRQTSAPYVGDQYDTIPRGRKPKFVELPPSHIEVIEGEPLTLRCAVDGDPRPVVTWFKGVRELTYSERHRVIAESESRYLMQVKWTLQTDPGEYTVVATNSLGHTSFTVHVNVLPRLPEDIEVSGDRKHPALREYELIKKMKQGKMPPVFIRKLPLEKTLRVGQTLVIKCSIKEAKMKEYLSGVDIVVKDSREAPDFLLTPADEETAVSPAAVAVNGHDNDDVSVTVLKNVVHIKDDSPSESDERIEQIASSEGSANVIGQSIEAETILRAECESESMLPSEAPGISTSITETDRTNESIDLSSQDVVPDAAADTSKTEQIRVPMQIPQVIVTEDEQDHTESDEAEATPAATDVQPKKSVPQASEEDIPSMTATSIERDITEVTPAKPETVSTPEKAPADEQEQFSTESIQVQEEPTLSVDTKPVASAAVSVERRELDNGSSTTNEKGPAESIPAESIHPGVVPSPDPRTNKSSEIQNTATGDVVEKKPKSKKSKKTELASKSEEELEDTAADDDSKKSTNKGGKPKKSKKKENDSENQEQAPVVRQALQDQSAAEGRSATFQCLIISNPGSSNAVWYQGENELDTTTDKYVIESDEQSGVYRLSISSVVPSDSGHYRVQVSNSRGQCTSTAQLRVQAVVKDVKASDVEQSQSSEEEDSDDPDE